MKAAQTKKAVSAGKKKDAAVARKPGSQSVERALSILDLFIDKSEPLSLSELAVTSGMVKPTVLRCLTSLERAGYITRLPNARYHLAAKAMQLGATYMKNFKLEEYVVPALRALTAETLESTSFHVREDDNRLCLFRIQSPQSVREYNPNVLWPLDATSMSLVLEKFGEEEMLSPSKTREVFATFGITNPQTASLSTAVYGTSGTVLGAMTISGPIERFRLGDTKNLAVPLAEAADKLSLTLGSPHALVSRPVRFIADKQQRTTSSARDTLKSHTAGLERENS